MNETSTPWVIAVDTGGTFTDCLAIDPAGNLHSRKILSRACLRGTLNERLSENSFRIKQNWNAPCDFPMGFEFQLLSSTSNSAPAVVTGFDSINSILTLSHTLASAELENAEIADKDFELLSNLEAPSLAVRLITQTPANQPLPPIALRLGTTKGTNALLEGKGVPPTLLITKGFGDLLLIGNQTRPDLFALEIERPAPLYATMVEVEGRLAADGNELAPVNESQLRQQLSVLPDEAKQTVAVALLHSDLNALHEGRAKAVLQKLGFKKISCSSEVAPFVRLLDRAQTTLVNAYLAPIIEEYIERVESETHAKPLLMMTSAGGLLSAKKFRPKDSLLSGPAGGIVGAAEEAKIAGFPNAISFDMGGTSTDVSRYAGVLPYVSEHRVGNATLLASALDIHTVAAGGGSICNVVNGRLGVGPQSAGSTPGPACYGAGGPLTITDVNLLLGRLIPSSFEIPLSIQHAKAKADDLLQRANQHVEKPLSLESLLEGFLSLANQAMADAIRIISVQKGYSPKNFALVSFGGAGSQHACAIAELLEMRTIIVPLHASLLSAKGILNAPIERIIQRQYMKPLSSVDLSSAQQELQEEGIIALQAEGIDETNCRVVETFLDLRLQGQEDYLSVTLGNNQDPKEQFAKSFRNLYGYDAPNRPLEVVQLRVVVQADAPRHLMHFANHEHTSAAALTTGNQAENKHVYTGAEWSSVPIYPELPAGEFIEGPCLICALQTVIWVQQNWQAHCNQHKQIILERTT